MPKRAAKSAPAPAVSQPAQPPSSVVFGFRLHGIETTKLKELLPDICTDNSHHLIARKLCRDFVDGKLVYLNRRDRLNSREAS